MTHTHTTSIHPTIRPPVRLPRKVCLKLEMANKYGTPQSKHFRAPEKWRFFLRHSLKITWKCFLHILLIHYIQASDKLSLNFYAPIGVHTAHCTKLGVFFKIFRIKHFCGFIAQLVKKLRQWSLYEVIEDILPLILNKKRPLSNIWLLRYKQMSFGCFWKKSQFYLFKKFPNLFLVPHWNTFTFVIFDNFVHNVFGKVPR